MLQVSMDGPSTNWKGYDLLSKKSDTDKKQSLFNLGSCSLHVMHGVLKTGAQATGWDIDALLKAMYYTFHHSPARREDFQTMKGSSQILHHKVA